MHRGTDAPRLVELMRRNPLALLMTSRVSRMIRVAERARRNGLIAARMAEKQAVSRPAGPAGAQRRPRTVGTRTIELSAGPARRTA